MNTPKATPRQVAERSLDGVVSGAASVFPDRFSELVAEAVDGRAPQDGDELIDLVSRGRYLDVWSEDTRAPQAMPVNC